MAKFHVHNASADEPSIECETAERAVELFMGAQPPEVGNAVTVKRLSDHRLADGAPLELGMRVVDYDRKRGVVVDDSAEPFPRNAEALERPHQCTTQGVGGPKIRPLGPGEDGIFTCDSWFYVLRDDGTTSSMDCSRMVAEGGRLDC